MREAAQFMGERALSSHRAHECHEIVLELDGDLQVLHAAPMARALRQLGLQRGMRLDEALGPLSRDVGRIVERALVGHVGSCEGEFRDGQRLTFTALPGRGGADALLVVRPGGALPEEERRLTLEVMTALQDGDLHTALHEVQRLVRLYTGAEAVGIRLADGDDFPYFECTGFSPQFLEAERSVCAQGPDGKVLRDPAGVPVLECMCGRVLRGQTGSSADCFTPHGSFFSNRTSRLLSSTRERERPAHARNRCTLEGYESVGLFPLRSGAQTFGLLQVADHRPERFSGEGLDLLERLADVLGRSLAQRQTEQRLRRALEEKDLLLREVHHRVKNNLQAITSLLRQQAQRLEDARARTMAEETHARVAAMALVHDRLYASPDLAHVDMLAFVKALAFQAWSGNGGDRVGLRLRCSGTPVTVAADRAIPIGLMVHELVTNCLRHAFPDLRQGAVDVEMGPDGERGARLCVHDDGIGLAERVAFPAASTYGLSLVEMFAAQIGGEVLVTRAPGTAVAISFPAGGPPTGDA